MSHLSKRSTIYFDPAIHKALRIKSAETSRSLSELVDEALRLVITEDQADLNDNNQRKDEPVISYEEMLAELKQHGKI
ncbi:ribbon-helix-helix domain-containing protein [Nitrosomonas sp.]|uniref:ribbon-helix-helix domain-containing protein n=1 Tax=Nitrosomonas sp. TaxID=42353 RepID=UPI00208722C2|nr:ribbon-helix-helix domain-containing protein [Nitrosomonas sp.]GJL75076.1 MAG: hypothetical protein NMNS02_11820 [Nitrosomonas sp.]